MNKWICPRAILENTSSSALLEKMDQPGGNMTKQEAPKKVGAKAKRFRYYYY